MTQEKSKAIFIFNNKDGWIRIETDSSNFESVFDQLVYEGYLDYEVYIK